ncbi:hypothetical protein PASE110613_15245 [Paenibacillus sediminis]|uniref:Uncharacterized protein n=1 Tax=Paenibacillus sediminis TaxID=664909 RepID=A0ABS4H454_9BACL|nr:hypothetical protein [Paenibacillus sediminis]MBP1937318.1 hypothetical protein [Paenibacillus sediminis]
MFKRSVLAFALVLTITVGGVNLTRASADEISQMKAKSDFEKVKNWQEQVSPVVSDEIKKEFSEDADAFFDQAAYYYDINDTDNQKVVFIVDKTDTKQMQDIRKDLESALGTKVKFKTAKHNPKYLRDTTDDVAKYVDKLTTEDHQVGYDLQNETITVKANLTAEQIANLNTKFPDVLTITNDPVKASTTSHTRDYPFNNLGGGIQIGIDNVGNSNLVDYEQFTSGFIAVKNNQAFMVTTGHGLKHASSTNSTYNAINGGSTYGTRMIGYQHWSGYNATSQYDLGLIRLTNTADWVNSRFYTMNNGGDIDGQLTHWISSTDVVPGLAVNKSGNMTGITGGYVNQPILYVTYGDSFSVKTIEIPVKDGLGFVGSNGNQYMCAGGDSGSTVYTASGYKLVGIESGGGIEYLDAQKKLDLFETMFATPAYDMQKFFSSAFDQYTSTNDSPLSGLQG